MRERKGIATGLACLIIVSLVLLQLYSREVAETPIPGLTTKPNVLPPLKPLNYRGTNKEDDYKSPFNIENFCNNMPEHRRHPRGILITDKPKGVPLKMFFWRQMMFGSEVDWAIESRTLCPFPPELQPFFDHYLKAHIKNDSIHWETGYAPCWFWTNWLGTADDIHRECYTEANGVVPYIVTNNYTSFRDFDIIYFDYPFYDNIPEAPYFDSGRMPPRVAHQKWVMRFHSESIGYYPSVALPQYIQQFDFTFGSPGQLMDLPLPLQYISEKGALDMANVEPKVPFDKKPDHYMAFVVSNCWPKNNRNELMDDLVKKFGAHSYGNCMNNKKIPKEMTDGMDWENAKTQTIAAYPFALAAENSNCLGYVTEKIYNVYAAGAIPLYLGAPDITDYVPEGSYIDASDFRDTDEIISYMKTVDRSQFYKWKDEVKKDVKKFCKKCFAPASTDECIIMENIRYV
ncbi:Alpha 1,3 fucosyltransferase [Gamsiella multidivaricata]|nr:Alpha 1,3 fucosyltransferase [Gamsiella multidivaricata]